MCRLKMAENVKEAVTFIEQGHIRVGPETITDPAYLVTRYIIHNFLNINLPNLIIIIFYFF
jgi:ribosomal protein S4